jgi:hypothetical protein
MIREKQYREDQSGTSWRFTNWPHHAIDTSRHGNVSRFSDQ